MAATIDMPFGIDDLDKVFAMVDLLSNSEELVNKFKPDIQKFLVNQNFFTGHFKRIYNEQFDETIRSLIKKELTSHFSNWTPEEILILTDVEFLKMIVPDLFNQDNYKQNETKN